jgi:hypothetical protein
MSVPFLPYLPMSASVPISDRLRARLSQWRAITTDRFVWSVISDGLRLSFVGNRPPRPRPSAAVYNGPTEAMLDLRRQLQEWQSAGVIEIDPTPRDQRVASLLFPVPKRQSSEYRWCHDGRYVNHSVQLHRVRLESIETVRMLLRRGDFLTSIDLKSAYQHLQLHPQHRKYFGFTALQRRWRFRSMPFGLSSAPWAFTRVMRSVMAYARRFGVRLAIYLDDILIMAPTRELALEHTRLVRELLETLGFVLNLDKSVLMPTQVIRHLGLMIDSRRWRLFVPNEKIASIAKDARRVLRANEQRRLTVRQLAGLAGKMVAASAAMPALRFRFRSIQRCVWFAIRHGRGWSGRVSLSSTCSRDVSWAAAAHILRRSNGAPIRVDVPEATLTTDASEIGYGATLDRDGRRLIMQAHWAPHESTRSSNWRETTAVTRAAMAFRRQLREVRSLLVMSDNVTAVSCVNRLGSRYRHLGRAIEPLARWSMRHRIDLRARHLPGASNTIADSLSRFLPSRNDWSLSTQAFQLICRTWGRPQVDWFASSRSHLCSIYASRLPDPRAAFVDAMRQDWSNAFGILTPPFNLLHQVLVKVSSSAARRCVLVVPNWPSRPWFGAAMAMAITAPLVLPEGACVAAPGTEVVPGRPPPQLLALLL